jgi:predicted nucleic acid-binding protein
LIYVDSNVPMYLVGADHPNKRRVVALVPQLLSARESLVASAESFQEIVHRYLAIRDRIHLSAAYAALESMVIQVAEIRKEDVDRARSLSADHPSLSSRDCLHVSVMRRLDCTRIWSYDRGFDVVPTVVRIE